MSKKTRKRAKPTTKPATRPAAKPTVRKRPEAVDYAKFVKVWRRSKSTKEVAAALGITPNAASGIANRLRNKKVDLVRFPRRPAQPIDAKRLNSIKGE